MLEKKVKHSIQKGKYKDEVKIKQKSSQRAEWKPDGIFVNCIGDYFLWLKMFSAWE